MDKRQQIKYWFVTPAPNLNSGMIALGVILIFLCLIIGIPVIIAGTDAAEVYTIAILCGIGVLIGVLIIISQKSSYKKAKELFEARPSDQQMDQWLLEDIQEISENNPFDKLGIDKSESVAEPLVIQGPVYWKMPGFNNSEIGRRLGKDNFYRYTVWTIQVFISTEHYLGSYMCYYNWLRNTWINESTNQFFFKDVVSVSTSSISSAYTLLNGQKMEHAQTFQLNLSGDRVSVIINDESLRTSSEMTNRVDKVVQSIRAMVKQKKI